MMLKGHTVRLWFSSLGRAELKEIFDESRVDGQVIAQDERGLWVLVGEKQIGESQSAIPTMLIKWDYLSAVEFDYQHPPRQHFDVELA
jgi:hypothetical protein